MKINRKDVKDYKEFIERINKLKKNQLDLSLDEDLSIAVMNLISIEEHLYFSGMKTGKESYFELLNYTRALRKKLLRKLVKNKEGEVWCISKHLLASCMRLVEVGNKYMQEDKKKAYECFKDAFYLYSLFWGINLNMIGNKKINEISIQESKEAGSWLKKISNIVKKIVDCCKE